MALEDNFVEADIQELEGRFDAVEDEFAQASWDRRAIFDWEEECGDWFHFGGDIL